MLDIVNSDATQERARNLNALFAGKQIADTYTPGAPRNTVAFTDGTHVIINAATILPGSATAPADNKTLAVDAANFTNSADEHYKKHDSGRVRRASAENHARGTRVHKKKRGARRPGKPNPRAPHGSYQQTLTRTPTTTSALQRLRH